MGEDLFKGLIPEDANDLDIDLTNKHLEESDEGESLDSLLLSLEQSGILDDLNEKYQEGIEKGYAIPTQVAEEPKEMSFQDSVEEKPEDTTLPPLEGIVVDGFDLPVLEETPNLLLDVNFEEEGGLTQETRKMMLESIHLDDSTERVIDTSEFYDMIGDVLESQKNIEQEQGSFNTFIEVDNGMDKLREMYEREQRKSLIDLNNAVLAIQQTDEEITEYILVEGIYSDFFKIHLHTSPQVVSGDMPIVIELSGDYILYHKINPEPKVIKHLLKTFPNFKFTYIKGDTTSELNPYLFLGKCKFTL